MQYKHFMCAGGMLLVLASASYAADTPGDVTVSPSPDTANVPADAAMTRSTEAAVTQPSDPAAAPQPQVAAETPMDERASSMPTERMATDACADPSASGSLDCEKLKRRATTEKTAQASMAGCSSRMDAKGKVIFDDPTCPSRMGGTVVSNPQAVYRIRENPFFNLHIEKAAEHARAAEIAGNQGQAIDLLEHAQMSLLQAKEAQRAGNVAGLSEGIMSLREALRLPETSSIREATAYVRDARKNLAQAGGLKYVEVRPQGVVAANQ